MVNGSGGPLLVFGPRSTSYDFGPGHPLTPRRFGPGIDLLRAVGATPGLSPEPAADTELLACHAAAYIAAVRRLSADPDGPPEAGFGAWGDNPAFAGMHEAGAAVAGGSLRAIEAILRGDVEHAIHPGGGLHHAMRDRASGFCIYDDPALAIARARREGLRVLYVDLDVHHGDGVQALHWDDPGVLTFSIHESGRYLFPGSGSANELGAGEAAGTSVNLPMEPFTGESAWLASLRAALPPLAAAFGPDVVVSQHGADSHAWDPLAHLRVTTTAMGEAARLVDTLSHRHAAGRWLATGGGGYDAYRVVPRAWALTWLAGAHRETPTNTPAEWRERWGADATRHGQAPLPDRFDDEPNAGEPVDRGQQAAEDESLARSLVIRGVVVPRLLITAQHREWWDPLGKVAAHSTLVTAAPDAGLEPTLLDTLSEGVLDRLTLAPRTIPPANPADGLQIIAAAVRAGAPVVAAVAGDRIVGVALAVRESGPDGTWGIDGLGVAPEFRRRGLGRALLRALVDRLDGPIDTLVTVAERDPIEPLDGATRRVVARRLLESAGLVVGDATGATSRIDPLAILGRRR